MPSNTATKILDVAQAMVRHRGYSAFSYADISAEVGIKKASIHYHFPSKEDLVKALVIRYRDRLAQRCVAISRRQTTFREKVIEFAHLYLEGLEDDQICLCSMLTADFVVLPESIQSEISLFFAQAETWLSNLIQQGLDEGVWVGASSVAQEAQGLIAMLQGAQLMARSSGQSRKTFEALVYPLIDAKILAD